MQVSLNPCITKYNCNFRSDTKQSEKPETSLLTKAEKDKKEVQAIKVKTAVKLCLAVVLGLDIIYFAVKRRLKHNHAKAVQEKIDNAAKLVRPVVQRPPIDCWKNLPD